MLIRGDGDGEGDRDGSGDGLGEGDGDGDGGVAEWYSVTSLPEGTSLPAEGTVRVARSGKGQLRSGPLGSVPPSVTLKPLSSRSRRAWSKSMQCTSGTATGCGPLDRK